jgi:ELWxxDGT repeat protein
MELFVSDGTPEGTRLVREIFPGSNPFDPAPSQLIALGNRVYFTADDSIHGNELWVTNGTAEGTMMVLDIFPS